MDISFIIFISMAMFAIGIIGVLAKRNALIFFLSIELMLNSANLLFVAFSRHWGNQTGLSMGVLCACRRRCRSRCGLAIIINLFRSKQVVDIDQYNVLRG